MRVTVGERAGVKAREREEGAREVSRGGWKTGSDLA